MKRYHQILIFLMIPVFFPAQTAIKFKGAWERDYLINGEFKYTYQGINGIELGINFSEYTNFSFEMLSENVIFASGELKFADNKIIFGPKVGFGMYFLPDRLNGFGFHWRASFVFYEPEKATDLRIQPEIGLTFLGILNLNYAYSVPLTKYSIADITQHSLSLGFHFGYYRSVMNVLYTGGGM